MSIKYLIHDWPCCLQVRIHHGGYISLKVNAPFGEAAHPRLLPLASRSRPPGLTSFVRPAPVPWECPPWLPLLWLLLCGLRLGGQAPLQGVQPPYRLAPEQPHPSHGGPRAPGPGGEPCLLGDDRWSQPGGMATVKGVHYLFPVQGDRVKPDSSLLVY